VIANRRRIDGLTPHDPTRAGDIAG